MLNTLTLDFDDAPKPTPPDKTFALLDSPPDFSMSAELIIEPLAPLSLVTRMPGKYYRSDDAPTPQMLYGLLENALGWHVSREHRAEILKVLAKRFKTAATGSNSGFQPLLQYHVQFMPTVSRPAPLRYDDYWSQQLRGNPFVGGSRENSYEVIPLMEAIARKSVTVNESKDSRKTGELVATDGEAIHNDLLRDYFPHYYVSPTPREYIEVNGDWYVFHLKTSEAVAKQLQEVISNPLAPLYLGSNDGWVEAKWKAL